MATKDRMMIYFSESEASLISSIYKLRIASYELIVRILALGLDA